MSIALELSMDTLREACPLFTISDNVFHVIVSYSISNSIRIVSRFLGIFRVFSYHH